MSRVGAVISAAAGILVACGTEQATSAPSLRTAHTAGAETHARLASTESELVQLVSALGPNLCAGIASVGADGFARVELQTCTAVADQQFSATRANQYRAAEGATCLDAAGGGGNDGDPVIMWECHGGANQHWRATTEGEVRGIGDKCLTAVMGADAVGSGIAIMPCIGAVTQKWTVSSIPTSAPTPAPRASSSTLRNGAGLCMDVWEAGTQPGTRVATWPCHGQPNQVWALVPVGEAGPVRGYGDLCLADRGQTGQPGSAVVTANCTGAAPQNWTLTETGQLRNVASGSCIGADGSNTPGVGLVLAVCDAAASDQRWTAASVSDRPDPPTQLPPSAGSWTFCSGTGTVCEFLGLRDVRLVASNGAFVQLTAFHSVPCAVYGFGNRNPAPGLPLRCEYGPLKVAAVENPMPGMAGLPATITVPLGAPGFAEARIRATNERATDGDGSGSFRTTCGLAKYDFIDPIVYPGQANASHLHVFFGNTAVDPSSTPETLAASGGSTCQGGTLNRTAYWMPAVVDLGSGAAVTPDEAVIYYKTGYNMSVADIRPFPAGLRMIAGNKNATSQAEQPYGVVWGCRDRNVPNTGSIPTSCPEGDAVRLSIVFPQCWDGVNLDSPDHRSHMAFPTYRNEPQRSGCPATHPIALPEITEHFDFPVLDAGAVARWRLSSDMYDTSRAAGFSVHADWMNGWDPATMRDIVVECLNRARDCGVGLVRDGRTLY